MSIVRIKDWNDLVRLDALDKDDVILGALKRKEERRRYADRRFRLG